MYRGIPRPTKAKTIRTIQHQFLRRQLCSEVEAFLLAPFFTVVGKVGGFCDCEDFTDAGTGGGKLGKTIVYVNFC